MQERKCFLVKKEIFKNMSSAFLFIQDEENGEKKFHLLVNPTFNFLKDTGYMRNTYQVI
jgi:hypothetical protein